jgi:hypothetical protein
MFKGLDAAAEALGGKVSVKHGHPPTPHYGDRIIPSYPGFADIVRSRDHFILVGDTQGTSYLEFWRERNDQERRQILGEIVRRRPAFVVHLGDLTVRGSSRRLWEQFDRFHEGFLKHRIPYLPLLGNHEFYGDDSKALRNYFQRFPHLEDRRWYSFTWKNVGLILVDSNFPTLTRKQTDEQRDWYLAELKRFEENQKVRRVIVCCHRSPFTNSTISRRRKKVGAFFADPFLGFRKTCFFFSGHSHTYERFQVDGKFFIVSGGGGAPRHHVHVEPDKRRYEDLFRGPRRRFFHFCEVHAQDGALAFRAVKLDADGAFSVADSTVLKTRGHPAKPASCRSTA